MEAGASSCSGRAVADEEADDVEHGGVTVPFLGEVRDAWDCPQLALNFALPLADVYAQMAAADVSACTFTKMGKDDASFFFIRGPEAVQAFSNGLRWVTRSK